MEITKLINDYLIIWILISVLVGLFIPELAILQPLSTLILAIMIGSISLTLSITDVKNIRPTVAINLIILQLSIPFFAFAISSLLTLPLELIVGFVILGSVTPELVSPVMTELSNGDTALSTLIIVITGIMSIVIIPGLIILFFGSNLDINVTLIIIELLIAVILPMIIAMTIRNYKPKQISRNEDIFSSISALMVIIIMMIITASNSDLILENSSTITEITIGVIILNLSGYIIGWLLGRNFSENEQITSIFSTGMRDFAVAGALILSTDLPRIAALPAVLFGIFEMFTSTLLVKLFNYLQST